MRQPATRHDPDLRETPDDAGLQQAVNEPGEEMAACVGAIGPMRHCVAPGLRPSRQCRSTVSTAALEPGPVQRSAPRARAWVSEGTAPPPMKRGIPGTAARTELAERATSLSRPLTVETMPTASSRSSCATASPMASAGAFPPSSTTSNPRQRRRSATIATGRTCRSPDGAARATVPRSLPRRPNCIPRCPTTRCATAVALCSSATETSPLAQRSPMECRAGTTSSVRTPEGSRPPLEVALHEPPRALRCRRPTSGVPGPRGPHSVRAVPPSTGVPQRCDVGWADPPLRTLVGSRATVPGARSDMPSCSARRGCLRPPGSSSSSPAASTACYFSTKLSAVVINRWKGRRGS